MRYFTLLLLLVLSISDAASQGIEFETSTWQEALEKAKSENKLLFVDSYAQWCGPCKKMAKYEFTKADVGEVYNSNFINLKLDMETPNGRTFDSQYPVSAYPTMFFLDGDGTIVKKVKGGRKGDQLIELAKTVLGSHDFSKDYKVKYDEGDRSYETVFNFVKSLNQSGKPSLKVSNEYLSSSPEISEDEYNLFLLEAAVEADSKLFEEVQSKKSTLLAIVDESEFNNKVQRACNNTIKKAIEFDFEDLYYEAITKAENTLTEGFPLYKAEASKKYALEMMDESLYFEAIDDLAALHFKSDNSKVLRLIDELLTNKIKADKSAEVAIAIGKKIHKKENTAETSIAYAKALVESKQYKKAIKVLDKSIKSLKKKEEKTSNLENFKKLIETKYT